LLFNVFFDIVDIGECVAAEIWLTEKYYEEFHERKDSLFSDVEAIDVYKQTQELQQQWPVILKLPTPWLGNKHGLFYTKHNWATCRLRICFGALKVGGIDRVVVLTCRTKQELSKGSSNGTIEWHYRMVPTHGYRRC
jgi:hypothetical protein